MTVIEFPKGEDSSTHLSDRLGRYRFDPLGFVQHAFPWGRPGSALAGETGPEPWQREVLEKLGRGLKERDKSPAEAVRPERRKPALLARVRAHAPVPRR